MTMMGVRTSGVCAARHSVVFMTPRQGWDGTHQEFAAPKKPIGASSASTIPLTNRGGLKGWILVAIWSWCRLRHGRAPLGAGHAGKD